MPHHFTKEEVSHLEALLLSANNQNLLIALEIIQNPPRMPSIERVIALLYFTDTSNYLSFEIQDQLSQLFKELPDQVLQSYEKELILFRYLHNLLVVTDEEQVRLEINLFQQQYGAYLDQRPHLHFPLVWLGHHFKEEGLESLAEQIYLLCIHWGTKEEKVFFNQALLEEYKNKDHKAAIPYYKQLLQLNPQHYTAHGNLGLMYQEIEQIDLAIHHFKKAISIRPNYTHSLNNLAYIYWKKANKYKEASALYEQVLQLKPNYNYALANYAALLVEQDKTQLKRAEKMLRKAIKVNPTFDYPWKILGHLMLAKKTPNKKAALNAYKKAHEYDPEDEETLAALNRLKHKK
ncbi:MAG: tetratricopeptide repeat protein [Aureispira sp.]